jgi:hypothetical protein
MNNDQLVFILIRLCSLAKSPTMLKEIELAPPSAATGRVVHRWMEGPWLQSWFSISVLFSKRVVATVSDDLCKCILREKLLYVLTQEAGASIAVFHSIFSGHMECSHSNKRVLSQCNWQPEAILVSCILSIVPSLFCHSNILQYYPGLAPGRMNLKYIFSRQIMSKLQIYSGKTFGQREPEFPSSAKDLLAKHVFPGFDRGNRIGLLRSLQLTDCKNWGELFQYANKSNEQPNSNHWK